MNNNTLTNIYINVNKICIQSCDHHNDVKKIITSTTLSDLFDIDYDSILLDYISKYKTTIISRIALINDIQSFIYILIRIFNLSNIRIIHPYLEIHESIKDIDNIFVTNNVDFIKEDLVIISNPCYPDGTLYTSKVIDILLVNHPNTIFVIDESDMEILLLNQVLNYTSYRLLHRKNLYVINSFKNFGLPNSINYILSHESNITNISGYYNFKHTININKIVAIEIIKNIRHYRRLLKRIDLFKQKIIEALDICTIWYSINDANVITIKILNEASNDTSNDASNNTSGIILDNIIKSLQHDNIFVISKEYNMVFNYIKLDLSIDT